jgi:predicted nuclease of predicted toxin-antitoxin system
MTLRVLADENVGHDIVDALRHLGHDVASVRTAAPGSSDEDEDVLRRAAAETRVLITADKDFGELAFRWGLPATSGVILLSIRGLPETRATVLAAAIALREDWTGQFAVVESHRVRITALPAVD